MAISTAPTTSANLQARSTTVRSRATASQLAAPLAFGSLRGTRPVIPSSRATLARLRSPSARCAGRGRSSPPPVRPLLGSARLRLAARDAAGPRPLPCDPCAAPLAFGPLRGTRPVIPSSHATLARLRSPSARSTPRRAAPAGSRRGDRNVAGLPRDTREPGTDRRVRHQREGTLLGHMRVGVERDVGDRVAVGDEEAVLRQVALHHAECGNARLALAGHERRAFREPPLVRPEAQRRDVRLVVVLLEAHPREDLGPREALRRQERRALREIPEDRVRLGQAGAVLELEGRDAAVRVLRQELGGARRALHEVELDPLERDPELAEQQPDLVAVAGLQEIVEPQHQDAVGRRRSTVGSRRRKALITRWTKPYFCLYASSTCTVTSGSRTSSADTTRVVSARRSATPEPRRMLASQRESFVRT